MAATPPLVPYTRNPLPILDGGTTVYNNNELLRIQAAFQALVAMTPQSATKAPTNPTDGMMRLSRDPWRPVGGTTVDAWVYYDGAGATWRLMITPPTNT